MSALLPPWCAGILDAPYTLADALKAGLYFTSFDSWPEEDRPPKRIWLDDEEMAAHAERVRERWKSGGGDDDDEDGGAMVSNAAADNLLVG